MSLLLASGRALKPCCSLDGNSHVRFPLRNADSVVALSALRDGLSRHRAGSLTTVAISAPHPEAAFRVGVVPGVTPDKWVRRWAERMPHVVLELVLVDVDQQVAALHDGHVDMCFLRGAGPQDGLHLIPLYEEVPVVVVGPEHPVAAYDEIDVVDLASETLLQDPDEVPEWRGLSVQVRRDTHPLVPELTVQQMIETVAAGAGIVILPMSVARMHHRKDVVAVPVLGVAGSSVGLGWLVDSDDDRVETFIGIVRGRTERSSRGASEPPGKRRGRSRRG